MLACPACGGRIEQDGAAAPAADDAPAGSVAPSTKLATVACSHLDADGAPSAKSGSVLWLQKFGDAPIRAVAMEPDGGAFLAHSADVSKIDRDGNLLWSKPFGGLVATDRAGNAYVAGTFTGTLALGDAELRAQDGNEVFLAKLDPSGNLLFSAALGGSPDPQVSSLAVAADGSAVVSGSGLGTVGLDAQGQVRWSKRFFGQVAFDASANVLMTGSLSEPTDFGAGLQTSAGGADIFLVKLSASGELVFSRQFGDAGAEQHGQGIFVDRSNHVIVSGVFDGTVDFGAGALSLDDKACAADAWCKTAGFVTKFDADGNASWSWSAGPMRALSSVATDSRDNIVLSGASPGGVTPFRIPLLSALSSDGSELWRRAEWPKTGIGTGQDVVVDPCDNVLWSVSVLESIGSDEEQPYIAKLLP
jgi:hypothetical protein